MAETIVIIIRAAIIQKCLIQNIFLQPLKWGSVAHVTKRAWENMAKADARVSAVTGIKILYYGVCVILWEAQKDEGLKKNKKNRRSET